MGAIARFYKGRPVTSVQSGSDCAEGGESGRESVQEPGRLRPVRQHREVADDHSWTKGRAS